MPKEFVDSRSDRRALRPPRRRRPSRRCPGHSASRSDAGAEGERDERGAGADADRALSVTRANRLSDEIRKAGFTGTIETRGRGADEPYRPVENDVYDDPAVLSRLANRLILRLAD